MVLCDHLCIDGFVVVCVRFELSLDSAIRMVVSNLLVKDLTSG